MISPQRIIRTTIDLLRKTGKYKDPEAYDYVVDKFLGRSKLVVDLVSYLEKHISKKAKVLDLAAGTGALSLELAKKGYQTYTTDISQDMMEKLQTKAKKQELKIISSVANLNDKLPFKNNNFSAIITSSANRYITNMDTFLSEVYRVLEKGGYFIWPILGSDVISWKINSGLKQPTLSLTLAKEMKRHGFMVKTDAVKSIFRNTLKGVPPYAIPTYLIGKKY